MSALTVIVLDPFTVNSPEEAVNLIELSVNTDEADVRRVDPSYKYTFLSVALFEGPVLASTILVMLPLQVLY